MALEQWSAYFWSSEEYQIIFITHYLNGKKLKRSLLEQRPTLPPLLRKALHDLPLSQQLCPHNQLQPTASVSKKQRLLHSSRSTSSSACLKLQSFCDQPDQSVASGVATAGYWTPGGSILRQPAPKCADELPRRSQRGGSSHAAGEPERGAQENGSGCLICTCWCGWTRAYDLQ